MPAHDLTTSKVCHECKAEKPLSDFVPQKQNRDGRSGRCRACVRAGKPAQATPPPGYTPPASKTCRGCGIVKPLSGYSPQPRNWDGCQARCKECGNRRRREFRETAGGKASIRAVEYRSKLKFRYGISTEEFARLHDAQGGLCAICRKPPEGGERSRRLHVDHDHETGAIRGLVCVGCNRALSQFGDTLEGVLKAVAYLQKPSP